MPEDFETVDEYIASFPEEVRAVLTEIRRRIQDSAPTAEQSITYKIPTFKLDGRALVYFAGWQHHVGIYPVPRFGDELDQELADYRSGKDTVRFPLVDPIPFELIGQVVERLVKRRAGMQTP
jgi:uncharacterized protein YdhG (YjbR/CyaY superfamily)